MTLQEEIKNLPNIITAEKMRYLTSKSIAEHDANSASDVLTNASDADLQRVINLCSQIAMLSSGPSAVHKMEIGEIVFKLFASDAGSYIEHLIATQGDDDDLTDLIAAGNRERARDMNQELSTIERACAHE